ASPYPNIRCAPALHVLTKRSVPRLIMASWEAATIASSWACCLSRCVMLGYHAPGGRAVRKHLRQRCADKLLAQEPGGGRCPYDAMYCIETAARRLTCRQLISKTDLIWRLPISDRNLQQDVPSSI